MSVKAMTWAWEQADLTDGEKLTLMAFADTANDAGVCWPSNGSIGKKLGLKDRAVRERVKKLEAKGLLTREKRERDNGSQTSNLIHLALDPPGMTVPGTPGTLRAAPEPTEGKSLVAGEGEKKNNKEEPTRSGTPETERVFEKWKEMYGTDRTKLTSKRRSRINARLKDGRTPDELIEALEGAQHSDWLMGRVNGSDGYTGIDTLLRDDDQVHRLVQLKQNPPSRRTDRRRFADERPATPDDEFDWET